MKRYAVFLEDGSGGMYDFVAAFETRQEADDFVENTAFSSYRVEDMAEYLNQPSPPIPTPEDKAAAIAAEMARREEYLANMTPQQRAMHEAIRNLARRMSGSLYGVPHDED